MAPYLVQARDDNLAAVGADVRVQIKPLPLFCVPGLEYKACDGGLLSFRKGPAQNNPRRAPLR